MVRSLGLSWIFDADDGELELRLTTSSTTLNKIESINLSLLCEIIMFHAHLEVNRKVDRESEIKRKKNQKKWKIRLNKITPS